MTIFNKNLENKLYNSSFLMIILIYVRSRCGNIMKLRNITA